MEVEERLGAVAVVDQAVEGREERDAIGDRAVGRPRDAPPSPSRVSRTPSARKRCSAKRALGLAQRDLLDLGIPALGEIPQPLSAAAARDGDDAAAVQDLEHDATRCALPYHRAMLLVALRRESPSSSRDEHRAVALELAQDVALEARRSPSRNSLRHALRRVAPGARRRMRALQRAGGPRSAR